MNKIDKFNKLSADKFKVEMWYDRYTRSWVVQTFKNGNQVGEATYVYSKGEAEKDKSYREDQIKRSFL